MMDTRQRSRRHHARKHVSWTAWIKLGSRRLRCHTVDLSANGARLRPRGDIQPGTPIAVQLQPPDGQAVDVDAVVWRVDPDSMAVMFLKSLPVHVSAGSRLAENGRRGWR
jgi:PilZ domain